MRRLSIVRAPGKFKGKTAQKLPICYILVQQSACPGLRVDCMLRLMGAAATGRRRRTAMRRKRSGIPPVGICVVAWRRGGRTARPLAGWYPRRSDLVLARAGALSVAARQGRRFPESDPVDVWRLTSWRDASARPAARGLGVRSRVRPAQRKGFGAQGSSASHPKDAWGYSAWNAAIS